MRITITARHTEIDGDLRAHTRELVEKVVKLARRPHHAQVVFTEDHGEAAVEIAVHVPRGRIHVAKAQAETNRTKNRMPSQMRAAVPTGSRGRSIGMDSQIPSPHSSEWGEG